MKGIVKHQFLNNDFSIPTWEIKHLFLGTFIKLVSPSMVGRVPKGIEKYVFMKTDWEPKISNNK
jgi:hypothetical protein